MKRPRRRGRPRTADLAVVAAAVVMALSGPVLLHLSVAASGRPVHAARAAVMQIPADTVTSRAVPGAVSATATGKAVSPRTGTSVRPGTTPAWRSVLVHGKLRSYLLATPAGAGPHPTLVVLHGLNEHTSTFLATTGIVRAALSAGITVVGPETPDLAWNDGRFGATGRDDDGYVMAVVDQLVQDRVTAPDRVTLAGFSNGAGMSMELSSRHPGRFAALVLVGGELLEGPNQPTPHAAIRTLLIHGTNDPIQPWQGRARRGPRMPAQVGVPATLAAFVRAAGATAQPATTLPHTADHIAVTVQNWVGSAEVSLYRLVGAGHVWPVSACPTGGCRPSVDVARLADVSATTLAVQAALGSTD